MYHSAWLTGVPPVKQAMTRPKKLSKNVIFSNLDIKIVFLFFVDVVVLFSSETKKIF